MRPYLLILCVASLFGCQTTKYADDLTRADWCKITDTAFEKRISHDLDELTTGKISQAQFDFDVATEVSLEEYGQPEESILR